MALSKRNGLILLIATTVTVVGVATFYGTKGNFPFMRTTADNNFTISLNTTNSPTLSDGEGTMIDNKGVTWEYHNASDYGAGHVALNHQGYVGVSADSQYGITAITSVTVNFSGGSNELWILKSVDGVSWGEDRILTSGTTYTCANNWRYIRFYNYSADNTAVNIDSIDVTYGCTGINASEDVDRAKCENILSVTYLEYEEETETLSPQYEDEDIKSTSAVRFHKTKEKVDCFAVFSLERTFVLEEIRNSKLEFDFWHGESTWIPSIEIGYYNSERNTFTKIGDKQDFNKAGDDRTHLKKTELDDDWWKFEIPLNSIALTMCDKNYGNTPVSTNSQINAVRLGNGNCVIDNLRIHSAPIGQLGLFNKGYSFAVDAVYLLKVCWVGRLDFDNVTITFNESGYAARFANASSPFYLTGVSAGSVLATVSVPCGYNRQVYTLENVSLTVTAS